MSKNQKKAAAEKAALPEANDKGLSPFKFTKDCQLSATYVAGEIAGFTPEMCATLKEQGYGDFHSAEELIIDVD